MGLIPSKPRQRYSQYVVRRAVRYGVSVTPVAPFVALMRVIFRWEDWGRYIMDISSGMGNNVEPVSVKQTF